MFFSTFNSIKQLSGYSTIILFPRTDTVHRKNQAPFQVTILIPGIIKTVANVSLNISPTRSATPARETRQNRG
jgi:hypothetical protein